MNLSIIGNPEMDESIGRRTREERKADREKRKAEGKPSRVKKVLLAVPRIAFLGLIDLNVRGLATRLKAMNEKNPEKLKAMWLRLGGDPVKLLNNVEKGAKKKRLLGSEIYEIQGVGFVIPTALASAAPIIAVVKKFLEDNNIKLGEGESLDDIKPEPGTEIDSSTAAGDAETPEGKAMQPQPGSTVPGTRGEGMMFSPTTGLLIGGALLAALFLFKKKK
jgi:hypothetical protein